MFRNIEKIVPAPPYHWVGNGFRVHSFFPGQTGIDMYRMSPFFLLDFASKHTFEASSSPRGVDVHPHAGIETVTIAYKGKIAHADSAGNSGSIGEGDIQWMTAGSGILHKEFHDENFNRQGGEFQMVQLWINLPAKYKYTQPKYQTLLHSEGNFYSLPDNSGIIHVIAGEYEGIKGKADTFSPLNLFDVSVKKNSTISFNFDKTFNTGILVVEGTLKINAEKQVLQNHFILFENAEGMIKINAEQNSKFLVLSGQPIDEEIFPYGPFVMNTREEIVKLFDEFKKGKFGTLD